MNLLKSLLLIITIPSLLIATEVDKSDFKIISDSSNVDKFTKDSEFVPPSTTTVLKIHDVYDENGTFVRTVSTFYLSGTYDENIVLESGTVFIDGSATVNGNLIQI